MVPMTADNPTTESSDPDFSEDSVGPTELIPTQIARFRIERVLGRGGFGVVYLGYDEQLQRKVAIKVPKHNLLQRAEDRNLYLQEARTVAGLEHPNIVPVLEVGSTQEFPIYIVSKFIVGKDLASRLKIGTPTIRQAVLWMIDLADALREAHRKGFVHRDVKPHNVLVDPDEQVYLVDFGLALRDEDIGKRLPAGGTPAYMSPEQARGEGHRVDGRSDLFSLGILFYELLCGRRPFHAKSQLELFEQITDLDPKPLRQWVDSVPPELERICFKMLAKRKSERYSSARDLQDDLKMFLSKSQLDLHSIDSIPIGAIRSPVSMDTTRPTKDTTSLAPTPSSRSQTLKIVPKGLRSFDHRDADFFLELLPGARDRDGLPESVGFWKSRVEEFDADQTFAVGLVYGPSGCGKSSIMKAGLLPRLSTDVVSVYLEATPDDTERRLLSSICKKLNSKDVESINRLVDLLHEVRRGRILPRGKKLFIVIDQFEQWLFAHPKAAGESLLESLLQCDGSRVQALVMVRDDFWMAATRFFRDLDIPLDANNSSAVDLFDLDHAERVLKAFGRAFGKLEFDDKDEKQDCKQFITDSVRGLSEEGKVISVRLALFAEMLKGRSWTLSSLRDVGGTTGVGASFLEETFSASGAPPHHRYHQEAARSVLQLLLPVAGTDIKGYKRSTEELLHASHYAGRSRDFDELIHILDGELRLITPVDNSETNGLAETAKEVSSTEMRLTTAAQYQLTHDYLVPSLRDWLTRKQRETRRGRAELKLAERAAAWNAQGESKQLPSLTEWLSISWLTNRKQWSESQRRMMQKARNVHLTNWGSALGILLLIAVGVQQWMAALRWAGLKAQTLIAIDAAQNNLGASVKYTLRDLQKLPTELVTPELEIRFDAENDPKRKLGLAFALARYEQVKTDFLVSQIDTIGQEDSTNVIVTLELDQKGALSEILKEANGCDKPHWRRKAKLASVALYLGSSEIAEDMCAIENRPDPEQRTLFIDEFPKWLGDFRLVPRIASGLDSASFPSALCLATGQIPLSRIAPEEKQALESIVVQWYRGKSDSPTHSAAGWMLRKWGISPPEIPVASTIAPGQQWIVNSSGMTMLRILPGTFHQLAISNDAETECDVEIKNAFWLSDREVTVGEFQQFVDDTKDTGDQLREWKGHDAIVSPTPSYPTQQMSWYDAIQYCNWLSRREGRVPCYEMTGEKDTDTDGKQTDYDGWQLNSNPSGYRLPTELEWEYACRAGTTTSFSTGSDETNLVAYALFSSKGTSIGGDKMPNGWGLFDMHGNVWEWCESYRGAHRVFRGGSWFSDPGRGQSAFRLKVYPSKRSFDIGFRLARNST